jgi:hypothetical protein
MYNHKFNFLFNCDLHHLLTESEMLIVQIRVLVDDYKNVSVDGRSIQDLKMVNPDGTMGDCHGIRQN